MLNRILDATRPNDIRLGRARAMDSTDIETWARTRTEANGRRWTKDPDVLDGHSPAKNGEPGRVRFLTELHLSVPVREEDGHSVPGLITGVFLGQANCDRARAIEFLVDDERAHGDDTTRPCSTVVIRDLRDGRRKRMRAKS